MRDRLEQPSLWCSHWSCTVQAALILPWPAAVIFEGKKGQVKDFHCSHMNLLG